jgi:hypothetical protein
LIWFPVLNSAPLVTGLVCRRRVKSWCNRDILAFWCLDRIVGLLHCDLDLVTLTPEVCSSSGSRKSPLICQIH